MPPSTPPRPALGIRGRASRRRRARTAGRLALAPLLLAPLAAPATAQEPAPAAPEARGLVLVDLESPAPEGASLPSLAAAPGGALLSWVEPGAASGPGSAPRGGALLLARWDGARFGPPVPVASGTDWVLNWADFPGLAALEDGTLLAHWLRRLGGAHAYGVELALSRDGGATWSAPRPLHEDRSTVEHGFVSVVPLDAQRFAAIWLDGGPRAEGHGSDAAAMALLGRTISASGELGPEVVLDPRVCSCCQTSLAMAPGAPGAPGLPGSPGGGPLAVYRDRTAAEVRDVSFVRFDGTRAGASGSVRDDGWEIFGCPVNGPRLAVAGGRLAAVWYTGAGGGAGQVLAAFFDPEESAFGPAVRIDEGAPEGRVDAVGLADGTLLVSWMEHEGGRAAWRVRRLHPPASESAPGPTAAWDASAASLLVTEIDSDRRSGFLRMAPTPEGALLAWTEPGPPSRVHVALARPAEDR